MQKRLEYYRSNVHSQNGEDGVIAEIIRRVGLTVDKDFWCVEFGAWDGIHLSNTFALIEDKQATAVMIEGDEEKFGTLRKTAKRNPSIIPVQGFVIGDRAPENSTVPYLFTGSFNPNTVATLDSILRTTHCPEDYDLLSIDIDSSDLEVWEAHRDFRPKIVVIEINSSLEPGVMLWHGSGNQGNSFSSTLTVATSKGYTLVCHTGNMIFVRNDLVDFLELDQLDRSFPERLFNAAWLPRHRAPLSSLSRNPLLRFFQRVTRITQRFLRRSIGL